MHRFWRHAQRAFEQFGHGAWAGCGPSCRSWEGPADEEPIAVSSTPTERVHRILQALPEHYREVLTCRFLLNLSIRDTANRMCLTEANVKVLQFRALKRAADLERVVSGIS